MRAFRNREGRGAGGEPEWEKGECQKGKDVWAARLLACLEN